MQVLRTSNSSRGLGLALVKRALIEYSRGQYLPVTKTRPVALSHAMPACHHAVLMQCQHLNLVVGYRGKHTWQLHQKACSFPMLLPNRLAMAPLAVSSLRVMQRRQPG